MCGTRAEDIANKWAGHEMGKEDDIYLYGGTGNSSQQANVWQGGGGITHHPPGGGFICIVMHPSCGSSLHWPNVLSKERGKILM